MRAPVRMHLWGCTKFRAEQTPTEHHGNRLVTITKPSYWERLRRL